MKTEVQMTRAHTADALLDRMRRKGDVMQRDCPSRAILQHLTSRWGVLVMLALLPGSLRFSALRRRIGGVSERMLAQTLQQLVADGMVWRRAHDVVPPHVDYGLTALGTEAAGRILGLAGWIEDRLPDILSGAQARAA
jgi:DNA-binding HxlR family transcriptional regulator